MKLNKILMALAATAIVGCTSDDLNDFSAKQAPEDSRMIELNSNFVLAGVGDQGAFTRTHWEQDAKALVNKFLPIYAVTPSDGDVLSNDVDKDVQAVGLCWLGDTPGAEVYTNYQFYHYGWLKKGETEAEVDNCDPFNLYNGVSYNEITLSGITSEVAGDEADENTFDWSAITTPVNKSAWELNYNSGVYKTDNKTIFGGKYIVYYPYNPKFQEKGTIPAKAVTSFDWNATTDDYDSPELGQATFRYSAPVPIQGGMNAANFGLFNLSTLVRLNVFTATAAEAYINEEIDKVILYSESEKLYKQANLGADKIAAGKQGQELYAETERTKTITVNFTGTLPKVNVKATTGVSAYITVLPTTVDDLVALVHNKTHDFWYRVQLPATEFKAGNGQVINITVKEANITTDYVAVDQASLEAALKAADAAASESNPQTITVIGDIELSSNLTIDATLLTYSNGKYITIDGGAIIVPQGKKLTIETLKEVKSDIRVLGKDCCTTGVDGGRLVVNSTSTDPKDVITLNNVTLEKTEAKVLNETDFEKYNPMVTYQGTTGAANIVIADGKKVNVIGGTVKVDWAVEHKGDIEIAKDGKVNVSSTGNLSFLGSTVDNYGTIEVAKKGQFYMKNANGSSVWTDGQTMTNHETGKFIHNVDAVVGTAVQFMNQNGEYRCRVDKQKALDDAYTQWTACNVIEMVDAGAATYDLAKACQHKHKGVDKYIDIEVNNPSNETTFNDPAPSTGNSDGLNIQIGNLTVVKGSKPLTINYPKIGTKQRQLTVNGNMTASENTTLKESDKITVTGNLAIDNKAKLTYAGGKKIVNGLKVNGDITVTDATFDASADGAILIECKNFSLINKDATYTSTAATFGNRTAGDNNKSMTVKGTISNGKGCKFTISPASGANLLAWITCYKVEGEGTFAGTPTVIQPTE